MRFSGGLLLGNDFTQEMYAHMGFDKPYSFREVKEITLCEGRVTSVRDYSERMWRLRDRAPEISAKERASGGVIERKSGDESRDSVTYAFDLDYRSWALAVGL